MQLEQHADMVSRSLVDGNLGFESELKVLAEPDNTRIHCTGSLPFTVCIEAGTKRELHYGNHPAKRLFEADILHEGLQILQIVLESKSPG